MGMLLLVVATLAPILAAALVLAIWVWWVRRDGTRSPINTKVINLPGEGLRRRLADLTDNYWESCATVLVIGPIIAAAWLMTRVSTVISDWSQLRLGAGDAIIFTAGLGMFAWSLTKAVRTLRELRKVRRGLEAEVAVAQNLGPLVAEGALLFHDFPADRFNIDHIVIGKSAVFAIETKGRRKPGKQGKDTARVVYDGRSLQFPGWTETKPLEQAKFQAAWLEKFLASGVGEPVRVVALLALPGWYVESPPSRTEVLVSNCRTPGFMAGDKFGPLLDESMRRRIAHVLVERYPPVEF